MSIISDMNRSLTMVLILIALCGVTGDAQTLVEAAQQERARQAQLKTSHVFTDSNAHTVGPLIVAPVKPELAVPSAPSGPSVPSVASPALKAEVPDPKAIVEKMIRELRAKLRTL